MKTLLFFCLIWTSEVASVCSNSSQIEFWYNATFLYNDIHDAVPVETMASCLKLCLETAACMAFSYSSFLHVCWKKSVAGTFSDELSYVTGVRCNHARVVPREADGIYPPYNPKIVTNKLNENTAIDYIHNVDPMSFVSAAGTCVGYNAQLPAPTTAEENEFLTAIGTTWLVVYAAAYLPYSNWYDDVTGLGWSYTALDIAYLTAGAGDISDGTWKSISYEATHAIPSTCYVSRYSLSSVLVERCPIHQAFAQDNGDECCCGDGGGCCIQCPAPPCINAVLPPTGMFI